MSDEAHVGFGSTSTTIPWEQAFESDPADFLLAQAERPLKGSAETPEEMWTDYFDKRSPEPSALRDLVLRLHDAGKHDHVAAVIRAALLHGQGQPWMYEVLALTLEIQGAPKREVERALLSQIDSASTDSAGLMLSAAYLTRFKADQPALRLYRQAADLSPERPEPYILGLNLAKRLEDDDALIWAVKGIFAAAWGEDHKRQHQKAENVITDRVTHLRAKGETGKADALDDALHHAKRVDIRIRLEWNGNGDLDLRVHEPGGTVCSIETPRTSGGGVLVHDGHGPNQSNCFDEYVCAAGFSGIYRIEVHHSWGDIVGKRAKLVIKMHERMGHESVKEYTVPVTEDGTFIRVGLTDGRRAAMLSVPKEEQDDSKDPTVSQILNQLDQHAHASADHFRRSLFRQVGGVAPVVGGGVVAYQPQVTQIPSGVRLGAQAVLSQDRRYVRLSLSPSFTEVTDVFTFTMLNGN